MWLGNRCERRVREEGRGCERRVTGVREEGSGCDYGREGQVVESGGSHVLVNSEEMVKKKQKR